MMMLYIGLIYIYIYIYIYIHLLATPHSLVAIDRSNVHHSEIRSDMVVYVTDKEQQTESSEIAEWDVIWGSLHP